MYHIAVSIHLFNWFGCTMQNMTHICRWHNYLYHIYWWIWNTSCHQISEFPYVDHMRGRFRLSVLLCYILSAPPPVGCYLIVHWGWFIQKRPRWSSIAFPPSLPQTCIISIKICRQRPSCSKQSCPRRVITVSINGRCILDMLETIDVFFIWKLEIKNTIYQLYVRHTDEFWQILLHIYAVTHWHDWMLVKWYRWKMCIRPYVFGNHDILHCIDFSNLSNQRSLPF
jgi:hypothetical protein